MNDHVWILRAESPEKTQGGLVVPDAVRRATPCQHGVVMFVGLACKEVEEGDVVFFDEAESRQVLIEGKEKVVYTVIPEECIYGRTTQERAAAAGL